MNTSSNSNTRENSIRSYLGYYLSEMVYGANDGIITTFAVVSGAAGAALNTDTVIILGVASLVADGFSMGSSKYLALRSEQAYNRQSVAVPQRSPIADGTATFLAFLFAGALPLVPFFFGVVQSEQFLISAAATAVSLFVVGSLRAYFTREHPLYSGFEMLMVGGAAAGIAYGVGYLVELFLL